MDDMILLHNDKEYLKYCRQEIEKCLNNNLKLELNNKTQISSLKNGIDFLGFRHVLTENGKVLKLLRNQAKDRLRKQLKVLSKRKKQNIIDDEYISLRLQAYEAHVHNSNSKSLYRKFKKINKL